MTEVNIQTAEALLQKGFAVVPLKRNAKHNTDPEILERRYTVEDILNPIDSAWDSDGNLGINLGLSDPPLIDIDLERKDAVYFGSKILPPTLSVGSGNKGITHYFYKNTNGETTQTLDKSILDSKKQFLYMNGREVFKHAVRRFKEVILEGLDYNNLSVSDVGMVIPHQANYRITQTVQKQLEIDENKVFSNVHNYGNTTAASIGIALSEALEQNKIKKGDIVVLASFGAGFQWGSVIIKW